MRSPLFCCGVPGMARSAVTGAMWSGWYPAADLGGGSPLRAGGRNREPKATASPRGGVGRKLEAKLGADEQEPD